jgi:UPF0716 protein FxsA
VFFIGVLLFIAAEIAAFAEVASRIGFFSALATLILASALGPIVVRHVGFKVFAHTRQRLERGESPTTELLDGLVMLVGGVLICVPGFVGDALGLLLMIGPVRHLLIRMAGHRVARRIQATRLGGNRVIDVRGGFASGTFRSASESPPKALETRTTR